MPTKESKVTTPVKRAKTISPSVEKEGIMIPQEEIALRAYFISERRRELGWQGNEESDWIDAEKQLLAEALEKTTL